MQAGVCVYVSVLSVYLVGTSSSWRRLDLLTHRKDLASDEEAGGGDGKGVDRSLLTFSKVRDLVYLL